MLAGWSDVAHSSAGEGLGPAGEGTKDESRQLDSSTTRRADGGACGEPQKQPRLRLDAGPRAPHLPARCQVPGACPPACGEVPRSPSWDYPG